jgi:hypothetical protein
MSSLPIQVTTELARWVIHENKPFIIKLRHPLHASWELFWHPDHPDMAQTFAGSRQTLTKVNFGLLRAAQKVSLGWKYAPWTLSDPKGVVGEVLTPLPDGGLYNLVRHYVWIDVDHVEARDESNNLVLILTELGARELCGRQSVTRGIPTPRFSPRPR